MTIILELCYWKINQNQFIILKLNLIRKTLNLITTKNIFKKINNKKPQQFFLEMTTLEANLPSGLGSGEGHANGEDNSKVTGTNVRRSNSLKHLNNVNLRERQYCRYRLRLLELEKRYVSTCIVILCLIDLIIIAWSLIHYFLTLLIEYYLNKRKIPKNYLFLLWRQILNRNLKLYCTVF
jgi:hypothetical protein